MSRNLEEICDQCGCNVNQRRSSIWHYKGENLCEYCYDQKILGNKKLCRHKFLKQRLTREISIKLIRIKCGDCGKRQWTFEFGQKRKITLRF